MYYDRGGKKCRWVALLGGMSAHGEWDLGWDEKNELEESFSPDG